MQTLISNISNSVLESVNKETSYAYEYHDKTKHSEISLTLSRHYLDWDSKPFPFKIYTDLPFIALPTDFPKPTLGTLSSLIHSRKVDSGSDFDKRNLAELLYFSAGITRILHVDGETYYMRAASATGALYPIEIYLVSQDIPGLKAGVYHFCPGDFSLTMLRDGDYRSFLADAAGDSSSILHSPITLAFTSIAWRNAWKYQARSYRHWFWDCGVIVANLLATISAHGFSTQMIMGFVDSAVNRLLRLDGMQENTLVLGTISGNSDVAISPKVKAEDLPTPAIVPISMGKESEYPEIGIIHQASSLLDKEEVKLWNASGVKALRRKDRSESVGYPLTFEAPILREPSLEETILLRGSSRKFSGGTISLTQLSNILYYATRGVPLDFLENDKSVDTQISSIIDIYLIVNSVTGLQDGAYFFDLNKQALSKLKSGRFSELAGYLCLGQSLFVASNVVFFLMADLDNILDALGNRGYRSSQFEAGVIAGKIYLAAYAQKMGASGSTFFDDAVTEFFSPHASNKSTMIAVGVGIPGYKSRPGTVLAGKVTRAEILKNARLSSLK
jgi:SagB-type dehydrogenase family enzyme